MAAAHLLSSLEGTFRLLDRHGLEQPLELMIDTQALRVLRLRDGTQGHCRNGHVLASLREVVEAILVVHEVDTGCAARLLTTLHVHLGMVTF